MIVGNALRLIAFGAVLLVSISSAQADKRVALVIGNSAYTRVTKLSNPSSDAAAIAALLNKAGFDVVESRKDLNINDMRRAIRDFSDKTRDADIAVVFYAGHGIEVDGANYLVPVDAALERDIDVDDEALSLDRIVKIMEPVKRLRLVILDACRDNPFVKSIRRTVASRSIGRGLAKIEVSTSDTLIAFAAKAGSTASDGDGKNSPFTTALLNNLTTPGLDIRLAFGRVRDEVLKITGSKQEPFVYGSLGGTTVALVSPAAETAVAASTPSLAPAINMQAEMRRDYEAAAQIGTKEVWEQFLAIYSTGFYVTLARGARDRIVAEEARAAASAKAAAAKAEADAKVRVEADAKAAAAKAQADAKAAAAKVEAEAKAAAKIESEAKAARAKAEADAKAAAAKAEAEAKAAAKIELEAKAAKAKSETDIKSVSAMMPSNIVVASATAAAPVETPKPGVDTSDTARQLQAELRRVGCYPGAANGDWNSDSRRAIELFNKNSGMKLDAKGASLDALDVVKGKSARICPLECKQGYKASSDACIKITCPAGSTIGRDGACEKRKERTAARPPESDQPTKDESSEKSKAATRGKALGDPVRESMHIIAPGSLPYGQTTTVTARNGRKMTCTGGNQNRNIPRTCVWN